MSEQTHGHHADYKQASAGNSTEQAEQLQNQHDEIVGKDAGDRDLAKKGEHVMSGGLEEESAYCS